MRRAPPGTFPAMSIGLMRSRQGHRRTTNIALFFDLVYVFAITQLSHRLLQHPTAGGALQTGLLLVMVWLVWVYTTWMTNWLDPDRLPGGTGLFLFGHALFKLTVWQHIPWTRLGGMVVLASFGWWAAGAPSWVLGAATSLVVAAVVTVDLFLIPRRPPATTA